MTKVNELEFEEIVNSISDDVNKNKECNYVVIYFDWTKKHTESDVENARINLSQLVSLKCDKLVFVDVELPTKDYENGSIAFYNNPALPSFEFDTTEEK